MRAQTAKKYKRHRETNVTFGGDLLKTRLGRSTPRPISVHYSMHFVLRSTQARGPRSFRQPATFNRVQGILEKFGRKHAVKVWRASIHHNHIHLCLELRDRMRYNRFIRAVTAAIAMAASGAQKGNRLAKKFWDRRPFSRVVRGPREEANLMDYFRINDLEAIGFPRETAREIIHLSRAPRPG